MVYLCIIFFVLQLTNKILEYFKVLVNLFKFAISGEVEVGQGQDLVDRRGVIGSLPQKILRAIVACQVPNLPNLCKI